MFKYKEYYKGELWEGEQYIFKFNNGYGTSIVRHGGSYGNEQGLWELAVIEFDNTDNWHICYETKITDGINSIMGWLSVEDVNNILDKIIELKDSKYKIESDYNG